MKKLTVRQLAHRLRRGGFAENVEVAPGRSDFWTKIGGRRAQILLTDGVDVQASSVGVRGKEILLHHVRAATFVLIIERSKRDHRWEILYLCFLHEAKINARSFAHELRNFNIIDGHHAHRKLEKLIEHLLESQS